MNSKSNKAVSTAVKSVMEMGKTFIETQNISSTVLAGGNIIVQSLVDTGCDYIQRQLSNSEGDRVARSIEHIQMRISAAIASGKEYNEEFLINNGSNRISSVEICEGVIQKCKLEYEELKIPYISNIFAVAPFISEYSKEEIFYRLMLAEKLTYRQLCILSLSNNSSIVDKLKKTKYINGKKDYRLRALLIEIMDLYKLGLVQNFDRERNRAYGLKGILAIIPYNLSLTKDGIRQYELMDLGTVELKHVMEIAEMLT